MILVTTPSVDGNPTLKVLGMVQGNAVRAGHVGRHFLAGLRNITGGEVAEYSHLMAESRDQALGRMVQQAEGLGANAVVNLRFTTAMVAGGAAEILAYGTAVTIEA